VLQERWRETCRAHGFDPLAVPSRLAPPPVRDLEAETVAALAAARVRLTRTENGFSRMQFLCAVMAEAPGRGLDAERLLPAAETHLQSRHCVRIGPDRWTTREVLGLEDRLLAQADRGRADDRHQLPVTTVMQVIARRPELSLEQQQALFQL